MINRCVLLWQLVVATKVIENVVMVTPHVQMIGKEAACVSYVRVLQILDM